MRKKLIAILIVISLIASVGATPIINPSVESESFLCRIIYTKWICELGSTPGGSQGSPGSPGLGNITNLWNFTGNFSAYGETNFFNYTSIFSEMNQTPNMTAGQEGPQGVPGIANMTAGPQGEQGPAGEIPDSSQFPFLNGTRMLTGIWDFGGYNISNLLDPVSAQDAATKNYVDDISIYNSSYWTGTNYNATYDGFTNYNASYWTGTNYNASYLTSTYNATYDGFTNYNASYWTGTNYNASYLTSTYNATYDAKTNYNASYWTGTNYNASYWTGTNYNASYLISTYNATYDGFTNYNASYWTGTNYNASYLTSTYNATYNSHTTLAAALAAVYPVGSIYISTVVTNPATTFGFGTWTTFGNGRVLVGNNTGDADFDVVKETGGSKTNASIVTHTHTTTVYVGTTDGTYGTFDSSSTTPGTSKALTSAAPAGAVASISIVQPYIVVYFWERTA